MANAAQQAEEVRLLNTKPTSKGHRKRLDKSAKSASYKPKTTDWNLQIPKCFKGKGLLLQVDFCGSNLAHLVFLFDGSSILHGWELSAQERATLKEQLQHALPSLLELFHELETGKRPTGIGMKHQTATPPFQDQDGSGMLTEEENGPQGFWHGCWPLEP